MTVHLHSGYRDRRQLFQVRQFKQQLLGLHRLQPLHVEGHDGQRGQGGVQAGAEGDGDRISEPSGHGGGACVGEWLGV